MNEGQMVILGICAIGLSYRAYRIGIQAGIDRYVEFCKDLSRAHNGKVLIMFYGQNIAFLNPITQKKLDDDDIFKKKSNDDKRP